MTGEDKGSRIECLLIGTGIGDQVGDLQWAAQEIGEAEPGSDEHTAALAVMTTLGGDLFEAVGQAQEKCDLDPGGTVVHLTAELARSVEAGDLQRIRSALNGLSDALGQERSGTGG